MYHFMDIDIELHNLPPPPPMETFKINLTMNTYIYFLNSSHNCRCTRVSDLCVEFY